MDTVYAGLVRASTLSKFLKTSRLSGLEKAPPKWDPASHTHGIHTSRDSGNPVVCMADRVPRAFFWSSSNFPVEGLADEFVDILRVLRNLQRSDLLNMTPKPECLITLVTYLGVGALVNV